MCPEEWWWLYDVKREQDKSSIYAGRLDDDCVSDLYNWLKAEG
jgi:hypothetical protein